VSDNKHGSLGKNIFRSILTITSHSASKVNVLMPFKHMGIIKPLHVRHKHVGMTWMTTEIKHRTMNVSKAFVITRRFIGSVGTNSGTAQCKHCIGVSTHIRRVILSGMHCEIYKKKINKTPLQKQQKNPT